jgi:hypothetical protein
MSTPPNPPAEPPKSPPEPPGTPPPPPNDYSAQEVHPTIPAVVSLFAPGLGLLLLKTRDRVKDALLIFVIWVACVMAVILLSILTFGIGVVCCGVPLFLYNIAAAIHSYDEAILLEGEKPLLFQKGFRIFKD